jgi:CheY-like chemotaxis protein
MHQVADNGTRAAQAAARLAELLTRLRRVVAGVAYEAPPPGEVAADPRLPGIEMAARLLAVPAREEGAEDLGRLGRVVTALTAFLSEHPDAAQPPAPGLLAALASGLQHALRRLDAGAVGADVADDPVWDAVSAAPEAAAAIPVDRRTPSSQRPLPVVLLVTSGFRRDQVRRRLEQHGRTVSEAPDAAAAAGHARRGDALVVCDNLEPVKHLAHVLELLGADPAARRRVVMVTGGSPGRGEVDRGRALGLGGVWGEPYDPMQLARP